LIIIIIFAIFDIDGMMLSHYDAISLAPLYYAIAFHFRLIIFFHDCRHSPPLMLRCLRHYCHFIAFIFIIDRYAIASRVLAANATCIRPHSAMIRVDMFCAALLDVDIASFS